MNEHMSVDIYPMVKIEISKKQLLLQILFELKAVLKNAKDSAERAHKTATAKESIAENKYDTFGLEASYLAHGQSKRVAECEADLEAFKRLLEHNPLEEKNVLVGSLVLLIDELKVERYIFLGPAAGGLKLIYHKKEVVVVTPEAPIGKALLGRRVDDEIELSLGSQKKHYIIEQII
jgi:transcription elongation GreA/GreB family factor